MSPPSGTPAAPPGAAVRSRPPDLVIRASRAVTDHGEVPATVSVRDGRIVAVEVLPSRAPAGAAAQVIELGPDVVLLPGLVDSHVHIGEPGHTDWEGFDTATRAAAAGGITTLVDMPVDSVPATVDVAALEVKRAAATGRCHVDVGFWAGVTPGNTGELEALHRAGVLGFKCFLADSGAPDLPPLSPAGLVTAMRALRRFDGVLLVHAESDAELADCPAPRGRRYADFLDSRPARVEEAAVAAVIEAARVTGARAHIVHLSGAGALPPIAAARRDGVRITAETCPHYLSLTAGEIPDGATEFACCPPIRDAANRELLWSGLSGGVLDLVVSDHSPCAAELKHRDTGDFGAAWGGISSLQLALPIVWTEARRRGIPLTDVVRWMSERPARLAGLAAKGRIAPGYDADLCVLAPDEGFTVRPEELHHRQPVTPYAGRHLYGVVRRTWLRGRDIDPAHPAGRLPTRTANRLEDAS
ncbi:allantoinase AllB [Streptosporangium lutulentum]|uniref:allantoinase n=1 Tax=Streptosporangium lutulentum TaxID=1461250 RepID=A0ABT9Q3I3_9ACTN|nr:allantoinase AllB [Streptosporangium lutulentum]MDP9841298.1 allantoinase [Streptosporangium lutulentum]